MFFLMLNLKFKIFSQSFHFMVWLWLRNMTKSFVTKTCALQMLSSLYHVIEPKFLVVQQMTMIIVLDVFKISIEINESTKVLVNKELFIFITYHMNVKNKLNAIYNGGETWVNIYYCQIFCMSNHLHCRITNWREGKIFFSN